MALSIPILRILAHALDLVRPHVKLNAEQDAAWSIVRTIVDQPPTGEQ
jgi:hypothetical protein